jgi:hypothetical protein
MKRLMLSVFILCTVVSWTKGSEIYDDLKPGKFDVGLKIIETADETRLYPISGSNKENPRPVKMYVWYPAKAMYSDCRLSVKCYMKYIAADLKINAENYEQTIGSLKNNYSLFKDQDEKYLQLMSLKETNAILNALPLDDTFPAIILGQGNTSGSAVSNFSLCENLASNGFVVVSFPPLGTNSLQPDNNLEDIETLVQDLNFILNEVKQFPNVNPGKIGLIGFDICGFASFLLQMRNNSIDAMVCISNENTYIKCSQLLKGVPGYGPETLFIPMLHFTIYERADVTKKLNETLSVIKTSEKVDRYLVRLSNFPVSALSSFSLLGIIDEKFEAPEVKSNYKDMCAYTISFLNSYLNNDEKSKNFLISETDKTERQAGNIRIKYLPAKEL